MFRYPLRGILKIFCFLQTVYIEKLLESIINKKCFFYNFFFINFTLYFLRGSQRERSARRYGLYIPLSPRPLSSTSSYMPSGGSSCFLRDLPPISFMNSVIYYICKLDQIKKYIFLRRIDVLINCARVGGNGSIMDPGILNVFDKVLEYKSPWYRCCNWLCCAVSDILGNRGSIINISSILGTLTIYDAVASNFILQRLLFLLLNKNNGCNKIISCWVLIFLLVIKL